MILDLSSCSLEALYKMQAEVEQALDRHREQEPSTKRAHTREHEIWVAVSHGYIENIQRIRDAIIAKKKVLTESAAEFAKKSFRFCKGVETNCRYSQEHLEKLLVLILEIYSAALVLPDVDPETVEDADKEYHAPLPALEKKDTYFMVLDPQGDSPEIGCSTISMDLSEIREDLLSGLTLYDDGHITDALWQWRFDFRSHWSYHAANAINALNPLVVDF